MDEVELRVQLERVHADSFGWAMACSGRDRDAAEEILQTVYLRVLDGRARYDARSSFRTWLFGVIRRTAASERRRRWLHELLLLRDGEFLTPQAPPPPDAAAEQNSRADQLRRALARLAVRQREVLHLVFYHDLTVDDAAAVTVMIAGGWLVRRRSFAPPGPAPSIATWRAPTDILLRIPGSELLGEMPALGASVLDTLIPPPSKTGA